MITITIKTDNDAFQNGDRAAEVARILRRMAQSFIDGNGTLRALYDTNGNKVGMVTLTGKDRDV